MSKIFRRMIQLLIDGFYQGGESAIQKASQKITTRRSKNVVESNCRKRSNLTAGSMRFVYLFHSQLKQLLIYRYNY